MIRIALVMALLLLTACAPRYRVCWRGPYTGDVYCGQPLPRNTAQAWARKGSAEYPYIRHWVKRGAK